MNLVLIQRTRQGDAYEYHRYSGREHTNLAVLSPTSPALALPTLSAAAVELFRTDPETFFKEPPL